MMALSICLYAQENTEKQIDPEVELELIWEKQFEQSIAGYIVDLDSQDMLSLRYVYFIGGGMAKVHFFDRNGEETNILSLELIKGGGVLQSQDGEYVGFYEITKGKPGRGERVAFLLYTKDGLLLWEHRRIKGLPFSILNTGALLCSENPYGWDMFTLRGQNRILARINPGDVDEGTGAFATSRNSNLVFNVLNKEGGELVFYNAQGSELWRQRFNWLWTGCVNISDYGKYIAAIGQPSELRLHMFSSVGNMLWELQSKNCEFMDFSPDEEYLAAGIDLSNLHLFKSATGEIVWNYRLDDTRSFFSLAVANEGEFVVATAGRGRRELPAGTQSTIFLFDKKGRVVWRKEMNTKNGCAPAIRLTHNGKYLLICNSEELICYKIVLKNRAHEESRGKQGKFVLRTLDEIALFGHRDSTDSIARIERNSELELGEIHGDNDWIEVCKDSLVGWIRASDVKPDLSFVEGYKLRLNLWSIKSVEFEQMTGYSIEYIEHIESERLTQRYIYDGLYMKHVFTTIEDAKFVGDSLKEQQLLDEHPTTGRYYLIVPIFKSEFPHLYHSVLGGDKRVPVQCPLCDQTLCDPDSGWVNRVTIQEYELHQCVNKHHIIVFRVYWD